MSDRWFNDWIEVDKTYGHSIWFYGDCDDQRNFTFDSVQVNIFYKIPDYHDKNYTFTPSEVEAFFKKKKTK